jgi:aminoacrylate hydrolase
MTLRYELAGCSDAGAETLVLSAGLGGARGFWAPQRDALGARYRLILYDQRGTGDNRETLRDGHSIADMADDVAGMLDTANVKRAHFAGHALGGLIGLELALNYPERVASLALLNAWAAPNPHTGRCFAVRLDLLAHGGAKSYVRAQPIFLYPPAWIVTHNDRVEQEIAHGIAHFQGAENLQKRIAALLRFDVKSRLGEIKVPVLVAATKDDTLVPWTCSEVLAEGLASATFWALETGGHASSVTEAAATNERLLAFLAENGSRSG